MTRVRSSRGAIAATSGVLLLLVLCGQAVAFNPQPEPPAGWRVEGFADLLTTAVYQPTADFPFGVDPAIVGDTVVDFSAGIIATFDAPDNDGDGRPDNGVYASDLRYFSVEIGDTTWDEMMPNSGMLLQVELGVVTGIDVVYTYTMPSHPDLKFMLPASPGMWEALDERDGRNIGTLSGSYSLRDAVVPEPATMSLVGLGLAALAVRRRRR